ncbi:thiazole biosynthesis adenylyltransferase ThiF [Nocardia otitidiscaviarum]|uniref:Thiazole biosynthesis adenylyltransferase ThiF n=1 Tax=Nocardia otitidiscaviarum TaxID=1823 RepID=A0A378Y829_9NOCA|nr:Rv1355c family protein [Nocardia otitidiscaviarum]SUA73376.1 thiazole biosynthesis adenylyltransferase ThiF [Nocardia otitidiscaviarum]
MATGDPAAEQYRPLFFDESDPANAADLARLRADPAVVFRDLRGLLHTEFGGLADRPTRVEPADCDRWVYYPWRGLVLGLPGPETMRTIRLDRNRNKITRGEQEILARQKIGIVGQSVGHSIAHVLVMEGTCCELRLADFDAVELSNLNRLPGSLFDIGLNKAVVAARRVAELDPYLPVQVFTGGIDSDNVDVFLDGLSLVVEECDSLDIKLVVREAARRHAIPVIMDTSDRGLLDVERFDLEPSRSPFHGLLGDTRAADLRGLSNRDKAPHVVRILDAAGFSVSMAASLVEVGETISSWPQLGGDVHLGAAIAAAAVRRIGVGGKLPSGRTRVDLESCLDAIVEPVPPGDAAWADDEPQSKQRSGVAAVLVAAQRAPSGGNAQPWTLRRTVDGVEIALAPQRSTAMDIGYRGSALAVGAALYNARVAAASAGLLGSSRLLTDGPVPLTAVLALGDGSDPALARDYPAILDRHTNRHFGTGAALDADVLAGIAGVAEAAGGSLRWAATRPAVTAAADLLGAADRCRYLTPRMHEEMFAELRGTGDDLRTGLDLRSMEFAPYEAATIDLVRRADVMARVRAFDGGAALGSYTRDRVLSSSAVVAVTCCMPAPDDRDELAGYARAGEVVQRVWIEAERYGLAVQPVSPVFLFARRPAELSTVSPEFADTLTSLQGRFLDLLEVPEHETMALVLRLSYAADATVRSRRLPVPDADTRG